MRFKYRELLLPQSLEATLAESSNLNLFNDFFTLLQNPAAEQTIENPLSQLIKSYTPQANTVTSGSKKRGRSAFDYPTLDDKKEEDEDEDNRSKKKYSATII